MRSLSAKYRVVIATLLLSATAACQSVQTTWQQQVFNAQSTNGLSPVVRNINQASHWLQYCVSGAGGSGTISLLGSSDNVHYVQIGNLGSLNENDFPAGNGICNNIQGGGYYSDVVAIIANIGGGVSVSAWYSASTGAIASPPNSGYSSSDLPITFVPVVTVATTVTLKSTPQAFYGTGGVVLYGASLSNPNSSLVYVLATNSAGPGYTTEVIQAVPANSSVSLAVPTQGVYFPTGVYFSCSTSAATPTDPASACVVSGYGKPVGVGIVPN